MLSIIARASAVCRFDGDGEADEREHAAGAGESGEPFSPSSWGTRAALLLETTRVAGVGAGFSSVSPCSSANLTAGLRLTAPSGATASTLSLFVSMSNVEGFHEPGGGGIPFAITGDRFAGGMAETEPATGE
jgi:hypothetical protein